MVPPQPPTPMKVPKEPHVELTGPTLWPELATVAPLDSPCASTIPWAKAAKETFSSSAEKLNPTAAGDVVKEM